MSAARGFVTAEPHYIPGYTGYCPHYPFICGETYGRATHKLLLDPTIKHAKTLILPSGELGGEIPSKCDINIVQARAKRTDPVFLHPMIPGYEGFIPRSNTKLGGRYTVLTTERVAEFERQQLRQRAALKQLEDIIVMQSKQIGSRTMEERLLTKTMFKLPLLPVHPKCVAEVRIPASDEREILEDDESSCCICK